MTGLNWDVFAELPGAAELNFEKLCRSLVRRHFGQFGEFKELANQAGVEFHLKLREPCSLGEAGRWYGWQCKWFQLPSGRALGKGRRDNILEGLRKSKKYLPDLTDWVLWTRYKLTKADQDWFYGLASEFPGFRLTLHTAEDVEDLLSGPAALFRETYFGELVLTPEALVEQHELAMAPFQSRYQPDVHQVVSIERTLTKCLGGQGAWGRLRELAKALSQQADEIECAITTLPSRLEGDVLAFVDFGRRVASLLDEIYEALGVGDLDAIKQLLQTSPGSPSVHQRLLSRLRSVRVPEALVAANLTADCYASETELYELNDSVAAHAVAVLAEAGEGKSELAVQMTLPTEKCPGGVLLLGKNLHAGQNLDQLVTGFKITGKPVQTFERLVAAIDAFGQRLGRRIPIVIDGLNEAEDPRSWKDALAAGQVLVERFPYVLLVVTLRPEFVTDSLPDGIQNFEMNGFEEDIHSAIESYFTYYKIDPTDADLPLELLKHPLTLKIYCEVANRDRQHLVGVEALPTSLTTLFDRHFDNVAARIAELSPASQRIYRDDVREALVAIGELLWNSSARNIDFRAARAHLRDIGSWDASLLRSLESEGVLIRTARQSGLGFGVAVTYDLMAGQLIAEYLLQCDDIEEWIQDAPNLAKLNFLQQAEAHPLAYDIFYALVDLFPSRTSRRHQLWQFLPEPLNANALLLTARANPAHINRETVDRFEQFMLASKDFSQKSFPLLRINRAALAHPLDANFLNRVLRAMPNADRDLFWSEWLRNNLDEVIQDVQSLERRWDSGKLDNREMSRARWIMWTLTTNSRYLRDVSTHALYLLAQRLPVTYFELTLESLAFSDPYVPERMLAAAYGAALSKWSDKAAEEMRSTLVTAAQVLVREMFLPEAPRATTHALLRSHSLGIIKLALRLEPKCISKEDLAFLSPPFGHLTSSLEQLGTASPEQINEADDAAISMDFGNYTIGSLVPERSNYDFKHVEYTEVRRTIVARMLQLGYDPERFEPIDRIIGSGSRMGHEPKKIDRYGKKYGWIAYFEMWGLRFDNNLLAEWRSNRRPLDDELDPSFPRTVKALSPSLPDLFSDTPERTEDWIISGPVPDYTSLLEQPVIDKLNGEWVLIDGFVQETAKKDYRHTFTFIKGVFVNRAEVSRFLAYLDENDHFDSRMLPDVQELYDTYAGEIPLGASFGTTIESESDEASMQNSIEGGFNLEVPIVKYVWENRRNEHPGYLPTPKLCKLLELGYLEGQLDLFDDSGCGSLNRKLGNGGIVLQGHLMYLRKDLLTRYLEETEQDLVWCIWGERGLHHRSPFNGWEELHTVYSENKHIFKQSILRGR